MADHPHTEVFRKWNGQCGEKCNLQVYCGVTGWRDYQRNEAPSWSHWERYRIKPEKKLVPWGFDEWGVRVGRRVVRKDTGSIYLVVGVNKLCETVMIGLIDFTYPDALEYFKTVNGNPCGKYEETT